MNTVAQIGHNRPPLTPFEVVSKEIEDLYGEAKLWLDGSVVDSAPIAEGVGKLMQGLRDATKKADEERIKENEPFDKGKAEVQERYAILIADTKTKKGKTVIAIEACRKALAPWLLKLDNEKKAIAEKARIEADEKARIAREAFDKLREQEERADAPPPEPDEGIPDSPQSSGPTLEDRERAEALFQDAHNAEIEASRAAKDTAKVPGGGKRSISLRTSYKSEVTNATEFARYLWVNHKVSMSEWLDAMAKKLVDDGSRGLPGVTVTEIKTPV